MSPYKRLPISAIVRHRTFLKKLIPENGIYGHFGENADDTTDNVVGLDVCLVKAAETLVDVLEICMDFFETASRFEVCAIRLY